MAGHPYSWTAKHLSDLGLEELWHVEADNPAELENRRANVIGMIAAGRNTGALSAAAPAEPVALRQAVGLGTQAPAAPQPAGPTAMARRCALCNDDLELRTGEKNGRKWSAWRCASHGIAKLDKDTGAWVPINPDP